MRGNATQLALEAAAAHRAYKATIERINTIEAIRPIRRRAIVDNWVRLARKGKD